MKKYYSFLALLFSILLLSGCEGDDVITNKKGKVTIGTTAEKIDKNTDSLSVKNDKSKIPIIFVNKTKLLEAQASLRKRIADSLRISRAESLKNKKALDSLEDLLKKLKETPAEDTKKDDQARVLAEIYNAILEMNKNININIKNLPLTGATDPALTNAINGLGASLDKIQNTLSNIDKTTKSTNSKLNGFKKSGSATPSYDPTAVHKGEPVQVYKAKDPVQTNWPYK